MSAVASYRPWVILYNNTDNYYKRNQRKMGWTKTTSANIIVLVTRGPITARKKETERSLSNYSYRDFIVECLFFVFWKIKNSQRTSHAKTSEQNNARFSFFFFCLHLWVNQACKISDSTAIFATWRNSRSYEEHNKWRFFILVPVFFHSIFTMGELLKKINASFGIAISVSWIKDNENNFR